MEYNWKTSELDNLHDSKKPNTEIASDCESSVESFHTNSSRLSTATETELIDVDDIELSDEESWLYKSPKKLPLGNGAFKHFDKNVGNLDSQKVNYDLHTKTNKDMPQMNFDQLILLTLNSASNEIKSKEVVQENTKSSTDLYKNKENEVFDSTEVEKIARLQEESLRQSTSKFFTLAGKSSIDKSLPSVCSRLNKPASMEAINICNDMKNVTTLYDSSSMKMAEKQNTFIASSLIKKDSYHGSLPNINPGYYSLKSSKSRKGDYSDESKVQFRLPMSPRSKLISNGVGSEILLPKVECQVKYTDKVGNCSTLPSSYRLHSKNKTSHKNPSTPSPQREVHSLFLGSRNSSFPNLAARRESAPMTSPRFTSPLSSPTLHQKRNLSASMLHVKSSTSSSDKPPIKPQVPVTDIYHRTPSPSRRLPLSTMQNRSPKRGTSPAPLRREDSKALKTPSKIPSPSPRSGIPVPSYLAKVNDNNDEWKHDCF